MKKNQLTKLALLGIASGAMIASQGIISASEGEQIILAGNGCGGGKCGAPSKSTTKPKSENLTSDNYQPQVLPKPQTPDQEPSLIKDEQTQKVKGSNGCGGATPNGYQRNQGSNGCGGRGR